MSSLDTYSPRWIELDGAVNARVVVPGVLIRSDNLQDLTDRDIRQLVGEHQLRVVLDLRTEVEIASEGPGPMTREDAVRIEHRSLYPSQGNTDLDLNPATVKPWGTDHSDPEELDDNPVVRAYLRYLRRRPDSVAESVRAIAHSDGAVLVHCAAGKDRTGTVVAVALDAVGVPRETIAADYLASTERISQIMERLLASQTYRRELAGSDSQAHAPTPGTIERVLEVVDERFGGTRAWLLANGLDQRDLALLYRRIHGSDPDDADGAGQAP